MAKPAEKVEVKILKERPFTVTQPNGTVQKWWTVTFQVGDGGVRQVHVLDEDHADEKLREILLREARAAEAFKPRVL